MHNLRNLACFSTPTTINLVSFRENLVSVLCKDWSRIFFVGG